VRIYIIYILRICIMRTSLTNPQEQNYVTQLGVFAAVYNNTTWRVAAAAEIAKPVKYGSLYRHIYIIYLYIIRCGHQSTSVVVRIVFFLFLRSFRREFHGRSVIFLSLAHDRGIYTY